MLLAFYIQDVCGNVEGAECSCTIFSDRDGSALATVLFPEMLLSKLCFWSATGVMREVRVIKFLDLAARWYSRLESQKLPPISHFFFKSSSV